MDNPNRFNGFNGFNRFNRFNPFNPSTLQLRRRSGHFGAKRH